jgi:RNase P subunit RPR2
VIERNEEIGNKMKKLHCKKCGKYLVGGREVAKHKKICSGELEFVRNV